MVRATGGRSFRARVPAMALAAMAALALPSARGLAATAQGSIVGRVLNGTRGGVVEGVSVTLTMTRGSVAAGASPVSRTGRDGRFAFERLETGPDWTYGLAVSFQDADYHATPVRLASGQRKTVDVTVYEATRSPGSIRVTDWTVWLDRERGVAVQHDLVLKNSAKTTFVGADLVEKGKRAVLRLPLAAGARELQYLGRFMQCCAIVRQDTLVHTAALPPGSSSGTVRYSTPSLARLDLPVAFPTDRISVLVPPGVSLASSSLQPAGQAQDRGLSYTVYSASNLTPGQHLEATIGGLESREPPPLALALFGVAAAAGAAFVILRIRIARRSRPAARARAPVEPPAPRPAPASAAAPAPTAATQRVSSDGPPPDSSPPEEAELLIEEVAALDLAFERGVLREDTYRRIRELRKGKLLEVLRGQDAGRGDPPRQ
ncbi:MAG: carboxypeptidase regulatory-like domain-containing protein [Acidobacteria bacterium]|nr:carboxypeptidase regulatory-like domain-containing protein [Acidobacteriota bacterium]